MNNLSTGLSPEQHEIRIGKVMASECAAYLGFSRYSDALSQWAINLGHHSIETNEAMRGGLYLEAGLIEWAAARMGVSRKEFPGTVFHPLDSWAGCTPDADFPELGEAIQIKVHAPHMARDFDGHPGEDGGWDNDLIPEYHQCQVQWEMYVTQRASCWLGAYFGGGDYRLYHIQRDDALLADMRRILHSFWRRHLDPEGPREVPEAGGSTASAEYLRRAHPRETGPLLPPTPEALELAEKYHTLGNRLKELEQSREAAKNRLCQMIGDHAGIEGVCTWKKTNPKPQTDWEALGKSFKSHGAKVPQFTSTPEGQRRFYLSWQPEKA